MTFQEKQQEIINLKKKIEKDIEEVQAKEKELTREISLGMVFKENGITNTRTIEWIKSKEAIFPYTEVWIGNYKGQHTCRLVEVKIDIEGGIINGPDSIKSV